MAPPGTRVEVTEESLEKSKKRSKRSYAKEEIVSISDNIGLNPIPYTLAFGDNATIGTWDGEILISLKHSGKHKSLFTKKRFESRLYERFPEYSFFFQPADLISQILYFGLPTPIDVKVIGYDDENNLEIARELVDRISRVPGAVDVHLHQDVDAPELFVNVNRLLLTQVNMSQDHVANNLLITNSDSTVLTPNFWINKKMGLPYPIAVQTPKYRVDSIESLMRTPISYPYLDPISFAASSVQPQMPPGNILPQLDRKTSELLSNLATVERRATPGVVNHYNIQPVYDIYANIQESDLGSVSAKIQEIIDELQPKMSPGNEIRLLGVSSTMHSSFNTLGMGLIASFLLIYLILVINFQSWTDPFVIIFGLPCALAGVLWALFLTSTSISISSLMGAIVVMGLATANSILVVAFANQELLKGSTPLNAALSAGKTRLRPVLMTACAMIIGMLPLALGIGEGSEQNAPLARAVIGGLFTATFSTLFLVPTAFSLLRKKPNPYLEAQ